MVKKKSPHATESPVVYAVAEKRTSTGKPDAVRPIHCDESDALAERVKEIVGKEPVRSFARNHGVSEGVLRAYILGTKRPGVDHLVKLAEAGGVTVDWLATGRDPKTRREVAALIEAKTAAAATRINAKALGMILGGILRGQEGRLDAVKAAVTAVEFYQDAIAEGLITPDGIGDGGKSAA